MQYVPDLRYHGEYGFLPLGRDYPGIEYGLPGGPMWAAGGAALEQMRAAGFVDSQNRLTAKGYDAAWHKEAGYLVPASQLTPEAWARIVQPAQSAVVAAPTNGVVTAAAAPRMSTPAKAGIAAGVASLLGLLLMRKR